jgi:hypothetical protein
MSLHSQTIDAVMAGIGKKATLVSEEEYPTQANCESRTTD